jgi:putative drug exporter of the RND superfamily
VFRTARGRTLIYMWRFGKYGILVFWLVLAAVAFPLAAKLTEVEKNDAVAWLPHSAEATEAVERAKAAFPGAENLLAVAVYARESGLTATDRTKAEGDRAAFARYAVDRQPGALVPSADGRALLLSFPLAGSDKDQENATKDIKKRLANGTPAGLRTALTGSAGGNDDLFDAFGGMSGTLLLVTAGVVTLVLLLTYRSPVLWLIPLLCVGLASQAASAAVYLLAKHGGLTVDFQGQSILTVLVFGVGVDYALLLIARYREELRRHRDRHQAMGVALRRSFPSILASAATVTIGLLCLLVAELNSTRSLGPVAAVGIVAAFLAMTTLLPALLLLFGRWLFWPFVPRYAVTAGSDHAIWSGVARVVGKRPRLVSIGAAAALCAVTLGIGNLSVGLPGAQTFTKEVGSVVGQRLVERHYPSGSASPADIFASAATADAVVAAAQTVDGVASVSAPVRSGDGRWVRVQAVLADAPDSDAAEHTVDRLRAAVHAVPGAEALVGGDTAVQLDTDRATDRDNRVIMPLILGVILLILVALLRALVAPLVLVASVVLSYAAALGAAGLILTAMGYPRLFSGLPLQAFLFLVALGVDYTIFLMTRAREEVGRLDHRRGVLHALAVTGGVITSAGLVLAATFGALGVLPLVPSVQMGVIVAVGVLLDTFVVRSLLVPALAVSIGPRLWWPGRPTQHPHPRTGPDPADLAVVPAHLE